MYLVETVGFKVILEITDAYRHILNIALCKKRILLSKIGPIISNCIVYFIT